MITVLFQMTIRPGRENDCIALVKEATATSRAEDGCLSYTYYRRSDSPRELMLFEQWRDQEALTAHLARLQRDYGPPDESETIPHRRRLPKAFLALFEKTEAVRYDPIE